MNLSSVWECFIEFISQTVGVLGAFVARQSSSNRQSEARVRSTWAKLEIRKTSNRNQVVWRDLRKKFKLVLFEKNLLFLLRSVEVCWRRRRRRQRRCRCIAQLVPMCWMQQQSVDLKLNSATTKKIFFPQRCDSRVNKLCLLFSYTVFLNISMSCEIKSSKTEVVKRLQIMAPADPKPKKGSAVMNVTSLDQFRKVAAEPRLTVVHFWASWANQVRSYESLDPLS